MQDLVERTRDSRPDAVLSETKADDSADLSDESFEGFKIDCRQELDFIDQLWTVLSRSTSYTELTQALGTVFSVVASGEMRPFIYAT